MAYRSEDYYDTEARVVLPLGLRAPLWSEELPGVHIAYERDRIDAVFQGFVVTIPAAHINPDAVYGSVYWFVLATLNSLFSLQENREPGNEHDSLRMSEKIARKIERLPHTVVWLVLTH